RGREEDAITQHRNAALIPRPECGEPRHTPTPDWTGRRLAATPSPPAAACGAILRLRGAGVTPQLTSDARVERAHGSRTTDVHHPIHDDRRDLQPRERQHVRP